MSGFGSVEVGDGRTIVARIAPLGVDARVRDGDGPEYVERIMAGAFRRQTRDPARVPILLNYEHREGLGDQIGRAVELVERDDGLHGTFVALSTPFGDQGLDLIRAGIVGLSLQASVPADGSRLVDGVVVRHRLVLRHVALTASPAYVGAEVVAVRSVDLDDVPPRRALAALDYVERKRAQSPVAP